MDAESGLQSYESDPATSSRTPATTRASGASCSTWTRLAARSAGCSISRTRCTHAREQKPCYAIANDEAFSAAYALASSAQRLFVTRTGGVGSIGVIAVHMDQSGVGREDGPEVHGHLCGRAEERLLDAPAVVGRAPARTSRARSTGSTRCSWRRSSRNRGLKPALVRNTEAGLYWGEKAISAGLADQVGSFDDALAAVTRGGARVAGKLAQRRLPKRRSTEGEERLWLSTSKRNRQTPRAPAAAPVETETRCGAARGRCRRAAAPPAPEPLLLRPRPSWMPPQSRRGFARSTRRWPRSARWLASPDSSPKRSRSA